MTGVQTCALPISKKQINNLNPNIKIPQCTIKFTNNKNSVIKKSLNNNTENKSQSTQRMKRNLSTSKIFKGIPNNQTKATLKTHLDEFQNNVKEDNTIKAINTNVFENLFKVWDQDWDGIISKKTLSLTGLFIIQYYEYQII